MDQSRHASASTIPFDEKAEKEFEDEITAIPTPESSSTGGKRILKEIDDVQYTAYFFSKRKKWMILTVVALCQTSMNYNAAVYANAINPLNEYFHITNARAGMAYFLITYAFGCELWAPWSEEYGRWIIMQASLGTVNIWQILAGAAKTYDHILAARILGGLCSAGGSVTLGMVADMFDAEEQQYAVLWASLWSCIGSVIGGICGGPIEGHLHWRWNFWIQLIFGAIVQLIHFFAVPETRATVMLDQEAKRQRDQDPSCNVYGPNELRTWRERLDPKEIAKTVWRPFRMLLFEPIVLFLSLLSGFSDALVFSFLESYGYVFKTWGFGPTARGLAMIALFLGYWLAYFIYLPTIRRDNQQRQAGRTLSPESRLWWLMYIVLGLPLGLLGSAFVVTGPPLPWIAPLIFAVFIGCANMAIYYATIDYMVAAYGGKYSASATGGNGFSRDLLAGLCSFYTGPMYKTLGTQNATFLLFGISTLVCIPVYIFYWKGPEIRARSKWAEKVQREKEQMARMRQSMLERREALMADREARPCRIA